MSDPMLGVGTRHCKCPSCGAYFRSLSTFDLHRGPWSDRRCLNPMEMAQAGLYIDPRGFWRKVNPHKGGYPA